jgi:hypothetical protein
MGNCVSSTSGATFSPASPGPDATHGNTNSGTPEDTAAMTGRGSALLKSTFTDGKDVLGAAVSHIEPEATKSTLWWRLTDVRGLNFVSPQRLRPHGLSGVVSVSLGLYFTARTLLGYHATPSSPNCYVTLYALCGAVACLGALGLIKKAPSHTRIFFQMGALLQLGMLYFTYRFDSFPLFLHQSVPGVVAHCADVVMAGLMVSTVLVLIMATMADNDRGFASSGLKVATCCGIAAIGSLCGYPVQLAVQGASWLAKVYRWYPLQQVAFPYYVYIPATMGFNVIFFSATLHLRKLVSTKTFVGITLGFVFGTLIPTVVLQEVYIPRVSTQKLLIFSPPVATSWWPRFDL